MPTSVDNRVVEMRFDNKEFESGVGTSISSLEKLKKSLKLDDAAKGFDELDKASKKLDFASISSAAESITDKFSVLGTISDQVLRRIGDAIYDVQAKAVSLVKSLSIDQVTEGWSKYADKTSAVQTIMAATAKDFSDTDEQMAYVNDQLGKLSWFTDETSYNFLDMVSNIGKFTSNGKQLDESVTAMQGISTWAAISGANTQEASRAMYNLSQALSTGAVKLMDWKSIENANMATYEFKETALETAAAMGELSKASDGVYKTAKGTKVTAETFNQTLSEGWFTSDVLMKTLDKYGGFTNALFDEMEKASDAMTTSKMLEYVEEYQNGTLNLEAASKASGIAAEELAEDLKHLSSEEFDLGRRAFKAAQEAKTFQEAIDATKDAVSSGWMESFEQIFGNYEEAKKLWTTVANELWDVFAGGAASRNEMLKEWHEGGGYEKLWQAVSNFWEGLKGIGARIGEVWSQIFPGLDATKLLSFTDALLNVSEKFQNTFAFVEEATGEVIEPIADTISEATESAEDLKDLMFDIEDLARRVMQGEFGNGEDRENALNSMADGLYGVVQDLVNSKYYGITTHLGDATKFAADSTAELVNQDKKLLSMESRLEKQDIPGEMEETRSAADNLRSVLGAIGSAAVLLLDVAKLAGQYIAVPAIKGVVKVLKGGLAVIAPFADAFTDFVTNLRESGTIERNIGIIQDWFADLRETLGQNAQVQKFLGYWEEFVNWINGLKTTALNELTSFFNEVASSDISLPDVEDVSKTIGDIGGWINDLIATIRAGWPEVRAFFEGLDFSNITNFGSSVGTSISNFFTGLFSNDDLKTTGENIFDNIWNGITTRAQAVDWGNLLSTLFKSLSVATTSYIGFGFADLLFGVGNLADSTASIPQKLVGVLGGVKDVVKGYSWDLKADAILKVAEAIGILAVSLTIMSLVPASNLTNAAVAISFVLGVLIGLAAVIGHFWGDKGAVENALDGPLVSIGKLNVKLPKLALTMMGFAAALFAVVAAVGVFALLPQEKLIQGLKALGGVLLMLMLTVGLMSRYGGEMKNAGQMAKAFIGIAVAIDLLIPAVLALTLLATIGGGNALTGGVFAIIFLLASMAAALWLLSAKVPDIKAVGAQLILMALALDLLIPIIATLTLLSVYNLGGVWSAVGAIVVILTIMAGAFWVMGQVDDPSKAVKGMLAMAVGVVAIAAALSVLSGQKFGDMMKAAGAIAILVVALGALGWLAGNIPGVAEGMLAIGAAVTLLGLGLALAGAGALAFAKALQLLSDSSVDAEAAGKNLAKGIVGFFDVLVEEGDSIVTFITGLIEAIMAVVIAKKAGIVNLASGLINAVGLKLIRGIMASKGVLIAALAVLVGALLSWLGVKIDPIASIIVNMLLLMINSVSAALMESSGYFRDAITNLLEALFAIFVQALYGVFGPLIGIIWDALFGKGSWDQEMASVDAFFSGEAERVRAGNQELQTAVNDAIDDLTGSDEKIEDALGWTVSNDDTVYDLETGLPIAVSNEMDESVSAAETGMADLESVFSTGEANLGNGIGDLDFGSFSSLFEAMYSSAKESGDYESIGEFAQQGLANGILDNLNLPADAGEMSATELVNTIASALGIASPSTVTAEQGRYVVEGLAQGISRNTSMVRSPVQRLVTTALTALSKLTTGFNKAGVNAMRGMITGLNSQMPQLKIAVEKIAQSIIDTTNETLDEHSPSRILYTSGMNAALGLAYGMTAYGDTVSTAASGIGDNALNGINDVVSRISNAIDNDWNVDPTIRPVLDLSNVQNGANQINGMLAGSYGGLNTSLGYARGLGSAIANNRAASVVNDNGSTAVVAAIRELRGDVNSLNDAMGHMQVVLDSKQVVGGISRDMNASLGRTLKYANRGM